MGPLVLTVDVEDWYQTSDFDFPLSTWGRYEDRVVQNTSRLLDLFEAYRAHGTFFILGCIAKQHPSLVREIVHRGHEVASHGGWHRMLTRMSPAEIQEDLRWSKDVLEDITSLPVTAFRAPSWSLSRDNLFVLEMLENAGYRVDSSMQPFRTPLSGMSGVPIHAFQPVVHGRKLDLTEFPPTVLKPFGCPVPFSGGLYLRTWPKAVVEHMFATASARGPAMLYTHPWEIDVWQPRVTNSWLLKFTHYYGIRTTMDKLRALLSQYSFGRLDDALQGIQVPAVSLE